MKPYVHAARVVIRRRPADHVIKVIRGTEEGCAARKPDRSADRQGRRGDDQLLQEEPIPGLQQQVAAPVFKLKEVAVSHVRSRTKRSWPNRRGCRPTRWRR